MGIKNIENFYPLSPMQQGMLFHTLAAPQSGVYFEQFSYTFKGHLNIAAFDRAWQQVIKRHPILRTCFAWEGLKEPVQIVHRQVQLPLVQKDWRHLSPKEQQEEIAAFLECDRSQDFQLATVPLMRLVLIQLTDNYYHFTWSFHHLLLDGWSVPLVSQEVFKFYQAFNEGQNIALASPRPYRDYIVWLQQQNLSEAETFWRQMLKGFTAPTVLWANHKHEQTVNDNYDCQEIFLKASPTTALQALSQKHQITLSTIVQGAWALLLSRYCNEEDVVFGATTSGRPSTLAGSESMVGLFINTLPVRVRVDSEASLLSWLKQIQAEQIEARQYEYTPLAEIQGWSEVPKGIPLFESIVVLENFPVEKIPVSNSNLNLEIKVAHSFEKTNYPLTLSVIPGQKLLLRIEYEPTDYLNLASISRILEHLVTLLEEIVTNSLQSLKKFSLLTETEKHQLLIWNKTKVEYPQDKCIHELFEEQVAKTPDAVAVVWQEQQLTYLELNDRANQLAHYLQSLGVQAEVKVGIYLERTLEMSIAILGVLKAGGAYVPIDPAYPTERITNIIEDAGVSVLITQQSLEAKITQYPTPRLSLDSNWSEITQYFTDNCLNQIDAQNLAYVIYTSGSTGKPKGVAVTQQALVNYTLEIAKQFELGVTDRILQFASLGFDVVVEELFPTWITGGSVVLLEHNQLISCREFQQLIKKQQLTVFELPTAYWQQWVSELSHSQETVPNCVRLVIVGGERISSERLKQWQSFSTPLVHVYGLTETTVTSTLYHVDTDAELCEEGTELPIGKPIANTEIYLLDSFLQPVPVRVAGELYIGGEGIARGYLNRAELTAERFIPNPFSENKGSRLYRTGDLARYLPDGNIEFLGRIDHQVKLRGFRIELGEIEAILAQYPAIASSIVILREDIPGNHQLVAYLTLQSEQTTSISVLRSYLESKLPGYMVPSALVILEALPLTANGKVDRKALPIPDSTQLIVEEYLPPTTPTQEMLVNIWQEILAVERIGVSDNFFSLGGHSLIATRVVSQIRQVLKIELPLRSLFEKPTIAELAQEIETASQANLGLEISTIEAVARTETLPLSYAQQRLWFLAQLEAENPFYNVPTALKLRGELNIPVLQQSLGELVRRHEPLRTTFSTNSLGQAVQNIQLAGEIHLPIINLENLDTIQQEREIKQLAEAEAERVFNLEKDSLLRVTLLRLNPSEHIILFTTHHIVSDEWSTGILVKEITTLYQAYSQGKASPLPELAIQYADFAVWQREWLTGEVLSTQLNYWQKQLENTPPINLSTDYPRPAVNTYQGGTVGFEISSSLTAEIKALAQTEGVTIFMTLLAAFKVLLSRYSNQEDIAIGTPIANRNRGEIEGLIGFFVNTLVLRTNLEGSLSFRELLQKVKEITLGAYTHQDIPFEQLVEEMKVERNLNRNPLFDVMFTLENKSREELALPGLTLSELEQEIQTAKFDLTLSVRETETGYSGAIEYSSELFSESTIKKMIGHFQVLLEAITVNPEQKISRLPLLTNTEQQQLLVEWNKTKVEYPQDKCIHELFEEQVAKTPDAVAVVWQEQQLTYRELNDRANQLAHYLRQQGVRPEIKVGICVERCLEMAIGTLGILKAGGAYVPLDPLYPKERLAFMLEDAEASILLSQTNIVKQLPNHSVKVVCLDSDEKLINQESKENLINQASPNNTSYVLYTSGSTGKPKAVVVEHQNTVAFLSWAKQVFSQEELSGVLASTSICFDLSIFELFCTLSSGGRLIIVENALSLPSLPGANQVTLINTVPSAIAELLRIEGIPASVRTVNLAGEALHNSLVQRIYRQETIESVFNLYGPSEDTTYSTFSLIKKARDEDENVTIGRPIANTQIYLLDPYLKPSPVRVTGEIYIAGVGIARGYLNRPELTAERFIPNLFSENEGSRLYKTGDLARYLENGEIEYLGRIDNQVKIRGFRIELGEIETQLNRHPNIEQAVVQVQEEVSQRQRLIAYLLSDRNTHPTTNELRSYLKEKLPEYMIPSAFILLEAFPLTPNGKIDKRSLRVPDNLRPELEVNYVMPQTEVEKTIAGVWQKALNLEKIGIHDNFFEVGGNSLLLVQVNSKLRQLFDIELSIMDMFKYPTINSLAEYLNNISSNHSSSMNEDLQNEKLKAGKAKQRKRRQKVKSI